MRRNAVALTLLLVSGGLSVMAADQAAATPAGPFAQVATGYDHSCALTAAGGVQCWGDDNDGELGDGANPSGRTAPVNVVGLSSGVASVTAGNFHTYALTTAGGVKCWGYGLYGELGDSQFHSTPFDVPSLQTGVQSLVAGGNATSAILSDNSLECWGRNESGELGNGTITDTPTPTNVVGIPEGVLSVDMDSGSSHACAATTLGAVKCWGQNNFGQLGDGTTTNSLTPVAVTGLSSGAVTVGVGNGHSCALMAAGDVKCWGWNFYGQVGNGTTTTANRTTSRRRAVGSCHGATVSASRTTAPRWHRARLECWGMNDFGQLGRLLDTDPTLAAPVTGLGYRRD